MKEKLNKFQRNSKPKVRIQKKIYRYIQNQRLNRIHEIRKKIKNLLRYLYPETYKYVNIIMYGNSIVKYQIHKITEDHQELQI